MSSFENIAPEPKKLFLAQLLKDDQLAGEFLCNGLYTECIKRMYWIVTRIYDLVPKKDADPLMEKLQTYVNRSTYKPSEVQETRRELSKLLSTTFYSELHLGIIPTSTLPGDKQKPENVPISDELSSRL